MYVKFVSLKMQIYLVFKKILVPMGGGGCSWWGWGIFKIPGVKHYKFLKVDFKNYLVLKILKKMCEN